MRACVRAGRGLYVCGGCVFSCACVCAIFEFAADVICIGKGAAATATATRPGWASSGGQDFRPILTPPHRRPAQTNQHVLYADTLAQAHTHKHTMYARVCVYVYKV